MRIHLLTAESPESRRLRDWRLNFPQLTMPLLAALAPREHEVFHTGEREIFDYYRMLTPIGYANAPRARLQMDYITDRLDEITVRILLVCGDEDPSLGPMPEIQKRIAHARFALLSLAGHFANRDQPAAFNRAVLEFLAILA